MAMSSRLPAGRVELRGQPVPRARLAQALLRRHRAGDGQLGSRHATFDRLDGYGDPLAHRQLQQLTQGFVDTAYGVNRNFCQARLQRAW
jgi:hypothetical protein